ncbi:hypothetical protein BDR03DRAFT_969643 [Suillus americanus]|nr:hypothetical protein BDR03DRAFT_969643 [Suillus americanus]
MGLNLKRDETANKESNQRAGQGKSTRPRIKLMRREIRQLDVIWKEARKHAHNDPTIAMQTSQSQFVASPAFAKVYRWCVTEKSSCQLPLRHNDIRAAHTSSVCWGVSRCLWAGKWGTDLSGRRCRRNTHVFFSVRRGRNGLPSCLVSYVLL